MPIPDDQIFSIRDIIDSQLETHDNIEIGRVADIDAKWNDDGTITLTALVCGPQALAGRVHPWLGKLFQRILRDRFEHRLSFDEVEQFGPTLRLRKKARDYAIGQSEKWIADHILRWIPGNGRQ